MIPKIIHCCWFGQGPKSDLATKCRASWEINLPDYEIIEWNEYNSDMTHPYLRLAYHKKAWAFVSDYVSLTKIYEMGGVYLDYDVEVIQSFNPLLDQVAFLGYENNYDYADFSVCDAVMGAQIQSSLVKDCLEYYEKLDDLEMKPRVLHEILYSYGLRDEVTTKINDITLYPKRYFYPYNLDAKYTTDCLTKDTYAVHHWMSSWRFNLAESEVRSLTEGKKEGMNI